MKKQLQEGTQTNIWDFLMKDLKERVYIQNIGF